MKTLLLAATLLFVHQIRAQSYYNVCLPYQGSSQWTFNVPYDSSLYYVEVDTTIDNNLWEFGRALKNTFVTVTDDQVLITDSLNSYPVKNTSDFTFYLKVDCDVTDNYKYTSLYIQMSMNSTPGEDGGMIETAHSGSPWTNLVNDPGIASYGLYSTTDTVQALHAPGFSGTFTEELTLQIVPYFVFSNGYDSIGLKFTFASDSIPDNLDGWMISNIYFVPDYENIEDLNRNNIITIYPDPASNFISVTDRSVPNELKNINIYNLSGQLVLKREIYQNDPVDISALSPGIYLLYCEGKNSTEVKNFAVMK